MNNIYIVMENVISNVGNKKSNESLAMVPDEYGYYQGVPVMALDIVTRNKTAYITESVEEAMNNPESTFYIRKVSRELFGEHGHPWIYKKLSDPEASTRLFRLDPDKKAVFYKDFYTKEYDSTKIIYSILKPAGPYGKYAEEQLVDPYMNFSTSLRALSSQTVKEGIMYRNIINLVTFDSNVPGGGFKEASKFYKDASMENFSELLTYEMIENLVDQDNSIAMEGLLTTSELNDILKLSKIKITKKLSCYKVDKDTIHIIDDNENHSIKHLVTKMI